MTLPNGYEMQSTFMADFRIAEFFGPDAVRDTYARTFEEWHNDYVYLTELVIVLNHLIWYWHNMPGNADMAKLYFDLWSEADEYACDNLKGEELSFFLRVTD